MVGAGAPPVQSASEAEDLEYVLSGVNEAAALALANEAVQMYRARADVRFYLDELDAQLAQMVTDLAGHVDELETAEEITRTGEPVATTYGTGAAWAGPQRPRYVVSLAQRARADQTTLTTTYLERLHDVEVLAAHDLACPHTTGPAHRCPTPRVRRADGTRTRACWGHLDAGERAEIRAERESAISARACPQCRAAAGQPCVNDRTTPTTIHQPRLTPTTITCLRRYVPTGARLFDGV